MTSDDDISTSSPAANQKSAFEPDWLNLPYGSIPENLSVSLHDGDIVAIQSTLLEGSITLTIEIDYLRAFHQMADGVTFLIRLEGVQSARATRSINWAGDLKLSPGISAEERSRIIAEHHKRSLEESFSWDQLEKTISHQHGFEIMDAEIFLAPGGTIALRLAGFLDKDGWNQIFLRADRLSISTSDGKVLSLAELLELGAKYWKAFAKKSVEPHASEK